MVGPRSGPRVSGRLNLIAWEDRAGVPATKQRRRGIRKNLRTTTGIIMYKCCFAARKRPDRYSGPSAGFNALARFTPLHEDQGKTWKVSDDDGCRRPPV